MVKLSCMAHEHEFFMQEAMAEADVALSLNEVPVGAVVVLNNEIIGRGHNQTITLCDPSLHAEVVAVRDAAKHIKNYRLLDATLYVTLEPCCMCAGLLVHSRIKTLVFGAYDYKAGAVGSIMNVAQNDKLNHKIDVIGGVLETQCSENLSAFFKERRALKKAMKAKRDLANGL